MQLGRFVNAEPAAAAAAAAAAAVYHKTIQLTALMLSR